MSFGSVLDYDDMDDMNCTKNEDNLEEAEMRLLQRQFHQGQHVTESQEEKDYKAKFFQLLDEVHNILYYSTYLLIM